MSDPRYSGPQRNLFEPSQPPKERSHAPFQPASPASQDAAKRITEGPAFAGNKLACLKEISRADRSGNPTTRKAIAEKFFAGKQNYVTGPVDALIHEDNYVYEEPARDRDGRIMTRLDKKTNTEIPVPRRIEGSAVLRLTPRGKAATSTSEAA